MNLHDVARKAGVSIATVSRVLNGVDAVKGPARIRVLRAVEALNYHPNMNARALSLRQNRTLGMVVSNLGNEYFVEVFRAVEVEACREGYEVLAADTDYSPQRLASRVRLMLGRRVAGLGVVVSEMDETVARELSRSEIPVVVCGVEVRGPNITNIRVNCDKGMQRLIDHLRSLQHRRMAFFDHHSALPSITERRKAFLERIASCEGAQSKVFTESDSLEGGRQAVRDLLASGFRPTAVLCVNDRMAIGALKEFGEHGVRIPENISLTGFDNISFSEFVTPALTTVHIDGKRIAHLIFQGLARAGEQPASGREIVIDPQLVVRESTGPAPD